MGEQWRPVVGYEGVYEVSDAGRVRSLPRSVRGRNESLVPRPGVELARTPDRDGYAHVVLSVGNAQRTRKVCVLVLEAFAGAKPAGLEACHNDGDKTNDSIANLRWDTRSENALDRVRHGTHNMARRTRCPQGHNYSPENTGLRNDGSRWCRACNRARMAARKEKTA